MKKLFLIIGAPGSGKTTDAELIAKKNEHITHYSAGDMFRAEVASGSQRGKILDSYMSKGNIVPIDIAIETIINAIKNSPTDVTIIDGYPRSVEQMTKLDQYLKTEDKLNLLSVIEIVVSDNTARDRVIGRSRGDDDNIDIFNNRMNIFYEPLESIRKFYKAKGIYKDISGEPTIKKVVLEIQNHIDIMLCI
jgi:adenylate kinase